MLLPENLEVLHVQQLSLTPANEVCVLHNDPESAGTQIFLTVRPEAAATARLCLLTPGWVIVTVQGTADGGEPAQKGQQGL